MPKSNYAIVGSTGSPQVASDAYSGTRALNNPLNGSMLLLWLSAKNKSVWVRLPATTDMDAVRHHIIENGGFSVAFLSLADGVDGLSGSGTINAPLILPPGTTLEFGKARVSMRTCPSSSVVLNVDS